MSSSAHITLIMFICVIVMSLSYFTDLDKRKRHDEIVEKIRTLQITVELFNNPKVVKTLRLQEYRAGTSVVVNDWDTVAYEYRRVGSALEIRSTDPKGSAEIHAKSNKLTIDQDSQNYYGEYGSVRIKEWAKEETTVNMKEGIVK